MKEATVPRDPTKAVDFMIENAGRYAKAKADRVYIEAFLRSKKALLMKSCGETSVAAQEREAYADQQYQDLLKGLQVAVEGEEELRWSLIAAQLRVEIWRTQSANNRGIDRAAQ